MGLNYDELKEKEDKTSGQWASYSDLFMVLSVVFLLLYVVASIRSGTFSIQKHIEYQKMNHEVNDLKKQIQVYNTLRANYLEKQASKNEQEVYKELMDKLTLLQDEANQEKKDLRKQAKQNEKKAIALNKYQQLIRNIINTNVLAKARIKTRDKLITKERKTVKEKEDEIQNLEDVMNKKKETIQRNQRKMAIINKRLLRNIKRLKKTKASEKVLDKKIAQLRRRSQSQINKIKQENKKIDSELKNTQTNLQNAQVKLTSARKVIDKQKKEKKTLINEKQKIDAKLKTTKTQLTSAESTIEEQQNKIKSQEKEKLGLLEQKQKAEQKVKERRQALAAAKSRFKKQMQKERDAFENNLKNQKLSQAEMAKKQKEFEKQAKKMEGELKGKIKGLQSAVNSSKAKAKKLKNQVGTLSKSLKKAKETEDARKALINQIKSNFKKAGVDAGVNKGTGEVVLSFGEEFFDIGKHNLKNKMKTIIDKFIPIYSKSLFKNDKVAKKIKAVEIIGFASPTYGGRYVDPNSLDPKDRKAAQYNLDLSYKRAKSIFDYVFDTRQLQYDNQQDLLKLVKVSGRSFFSAEASKKMKIKKKMSRKEFCRKYDCKKARKVIIKFSLK